MAPRAECAWDVRDIERLDRRGAAFGAWPEAVFVLEVAESVGKAAEGGEAAEAGTLEQIRAALGG